MGVLERWDQRNQAWADRKNAEPVKPLGTGRLARAFSYVLPIYAVVRFAAGLATGDWLSVALFAPFVALLAWALIRARRQAARP